MKKIWFFGDSFFEEIKSSNSDLIYNYQWTRLISRHLNLESKNFALGGTGLEYTYYNFLKVRSQISENDILIVGLSALDRRWFFKEEPQKGCFHLDDFFDSINEKKSIKLYMKYLNNEETYKINLLNFLYNVDYLSSELNLHTIIIPCFFDVVTVLNEQPNNFKSLNIVDTPLLDIYLNEYDTEFNSIVDKIFYCGKHNHITKTNSIILSEKIIDNIQKNVPIDLKTGFKKGIITKDSYNDPEFIQNELCTQVYRHEYKFK